MSESTVLLAALAIVASCVGVLVWVIKHMFTKILPLLEKINKNTELNTQATKRADEYLRERNGRDAEFWKEVKAALQTITKHLSTRKTVALESKPRTIARRRV